MKNAVALKATLGGVLLLTLVAISPERVQSQPQTSTREAPGTPGGAQAYRLGTIEIPGNLTIPAPVIQKFLELASGDGFDEAKIRKGLSDTKAFYAEGGFIDFVATPTLDIDEQKKVVNLTIDIDEGRQYLVNSITFANNSVTSSSVLRRELALREGDLFKPSALDLSLSRLNQLGLVEQIEPEDVRIEPLPNDPKVNIRISIKEKER